MTVQEEIDGSIPLSGVNQEGGTAAGGCVAVAAFPGGGGKNSGRYACDQVSGRTQRWTREIFSEDAYDYDGQCCVEDELVYPSILDMKRQRFEAPSRA